MMMWVKMWVMCAMVLLAGSLSGCTTSGNEEGEDSKTRTTILPVKGCFRGFPYWNISIAGCPTSLGTWEFRSGGTEELELRPSSSGFGLRIVASASPSTAEVLLEFENHTFELTLSGSAGAYEDFEPLANANTTVQGHDHYLVGSVCNETNAKLSVKVEPVAYGHLEVEYIEYGLVDNVVNIAPATASCNGRWTGEGHRIPLPETPVVDATAINPYLSLP